MTDRHALRFVHSARPPASDVRVFDSLTRRFLGAEFTFRVIGSSHYVSAPAYDFYELSSCEPVGGHDATTLRLDRGPAPDREGPAPGDDATDATRIEYATDDLRCRTLVERRPLAAFPAGDDFDLAYRFGEAAVTTVDVGTDAYETYHTYPEFDLALYTRTVFEAVPGGARDGVADAARRSSD